jgi:Uma2 family endonuclease
MATKVQNTQKVRSPAPLTIDAQAAPVNGTDGAYRLVLTIDERGEETYHYHPLTDADFLEPQEGDYFMQGPRHEKDTGELKSIFRYLYRDDPTTVVLSDIKMLWGIPGLSEPAPDVAVIPNVLVKVEDLPASFDVVKLGTRPRFVLEVVSPNYGKADRTDKVPVYEQAEIEEYVFIDHRKRRDGSVIYQVNGYRLSGKRYIPIQADQRGWLYSRVNDVWIFPNEAGNEVWVVDAKTGERILPADERAELAEEQLFFAEERAELAEERLETAKEQAVIESIRRQEAEEQAQEESIRRKQEAMRRQEAEQKALEEAMKRQQEAIRRQEAEQKAQEEAMKRQEAERQAAEAKGEADAMAAELARLRLLLGQS